MCPMKVQEYLKANGLKKLQDELKIEVREYPDRCVFNYSQIDSDKHNPIVQECRALILEKETWKVIARSFDKFLNIFEDENTKDFPISKARIEEKRDGSLCNVFFYNNQWNVATRSMCYAEGTLPIGLTFRQLFDKAVEKTSLWVTLDEIPGSKNITWIFELTSPLNRVVTPYLETSITLIGARNIITDKELKGEYLDAIAKIIHVNRPKSFQFTTLEETLEFLKTLKNLDEGFVMTYESEDKFWRLKCKSEKYLAIAHLRNNGVLSAKRVLTLVVKNEQAEYLQYFDCDRPYFDYVENIWKNILNNITTLYEKYGGLESQKEFALTIIPLCKNDWEKGILFEMRKRNITLSKVVREMDVQACNRLAKAINLKGKLSKEFGVIVEDDA